MENLGYSTPWYVILECGPICIQQARATKPGSTMLVRTTVDSSHDYITCSWAALRRGLSDIGTNSSVSGSQTRQRRKNLEFGGHLGFGIARAYYGANYIFRHSMRTFGVP
jgi:hypothetical protein